MTLNEQKEAAMFKITLTIAVTVILGTFILVESGIIDSLLSFLLSGAVPGTTLTVSPNLMMVGFAAIAWLVLVRMTALGTLNIVTIRRLVTRHHKRKERMPKKRFGLIPSNLDR